MQEGRFVHGKWQIHDFGVEADPGRRVIGIDALSEPNSPETAARHLGF